VFCCDQTIYSIYEYFVVNDVSINFKPNQTNFFHSEISCLTTIRIFTKTLRMNDIMEYTKNENFKYLVIKASHGNYYRLNLKVKKERTYATTAWQQRRCGSGAGVE
jgi:hypothetical protein